MKLIMKYLALSVFFLYTFLLFLPKENLYYLALEQLVNYDVQIDTKQSEDIYVGLKIQNNTIFFKDIEVATVDDVTFKTLFFTTAFNINNLKVKNSLKKFFPYDMESIEVKHNILNPLVVEIHLSKQFKIQQKNIAQYLEKTEYGYKYEYKF